MELLIGARVVVLGGVNLAPGVHSADRVVAQIDDRRERRPWRRHPCRRAFAERTIAVLDRLEPRFDVEVAGAIDTPGRLIRILETDDADMRRRRQIGLTILR